MCDAPKCEPLPQSPEDSAKVIDTNSAAYWRGQQNLAIKLYQKEKQAHCHTKEILRQTCESADLIAANANVMADLSGRPSLDEAIALERDRDLLSIAVSRAISALTSEDVYPHKIEKALTILREGLKLMKGQSGNSVSDEKLNQLFNAALIDLNRRNVVN